MSPRHAQFSKDDIVDAAFELVRKEGWEGFSVPTLARIIGCSTMPVYSQFANVRDLEDAVCIKGMELLKERMRENLSGDRWIDQAILFVRFAEEERHLYRALWDGRNPELSKRLGRELVTFISAELVDYPLFAGLAEHELKMIRLTRMMFAQKLAYWLNRDSHYLSAQGLDTEDFIRRGSKAIYDGFMLQFR